MLMQLGLESCHLLFQLGHTSLQPLHQHPDRSLYHWWGQLPNLLRQRQLFVHGADLNILCEHFPQAHFMNGYIAC